MNLDDEQRRAAEFDLDRPLLIHAGAGSGKTRTLTARLALLISTGIAPYNILTLTFTRKSAEMLRERAASLLPVPDRAKARSLVIKTTHSFGLNLLREYGGSVGLPRYFDVYDAKQVRKLLHSVLVQHNWKQRSGEIRAIEGYILERKVRRWTNGALADPMGYEPIFTAYQSELAKSNAIDFGDILLKTEELLRSDRTVRDAVIRRYRYVLVDEVQDLNDLQRDIVLMLLPDEAPRLSCVGDPNQSIYGWRGACKNIFKDLSQRVTVPPADLPLSTNYRSTPTIVRIASKFIGTHAVAARADNESGSSVTFVQHTSEYAELQHHVQWLQQRNQNGTQWSEMAVLVRTRQQRAIVMAHLKSSGVPCKLPRRGSAAAQDPYLQALFAYFRVAAGDTDDKHAETLLTVPSGSGIGASAIFHLRDSAAQMGMSLAAFLARLVASDFDVSLTGGRKVLTPRARARADAVVRTIAALRDAIARGVALPCVVELTWTMSGLEAHAVEHALDARLAQQKKAEAEGLESSDDDGLFDAQQLLAQHDGDASAAAKSAAASIYAPVVALLLAKSKQQLPIDGPQGLLSLRDEFLNVSPCDAFGNGPAASASHVHVVTVHAAKGLEWADVIVHRVNDGEFPCGTSSEERRVFYVALTRAKSNLVVSSVADGTLRGSDLRAGQMWRESPFWFEVAHGNGR